MSLWNKATAELVDIIEFVDPSRDTLVHRFERYNNEIKYGAQLIVREGQQAIFVNEGKLAEVFGSGTYTLETKNLPVLSTLKGWKYGFESPFKAEVYFVGTRQYLDQKWGTQNPIVLQDARFGLVQLRAYGTCAYSVVDAAAFLRQVVGTSDKVQTDAVQGQLRSLIVTHFGDALGAMKIGVEQLIGQQGELAAAMLSKINADLVALGVALSQFTVENMSLPDALRDEIFEYSRLNRVDVDALTRLNSAKAIENISLKPGGTAGMGGDLAMGLAMASNLGNALAGNASHGASSTPTDGYFVALDGQQQGPYSLAQLGPLVQQRKLAANTLVWRAGMSEWTRGADEPAIAQLLSQLPPPLPPA
ncbi:SPFH domain-containing protein [Rhodanobacter sp. L36]|uniref:SPFH domain-containing protein n=1 Tax=Rhodanobacter sp. L36 TaxID=1747221 RepID=UPI00131DB354|nr:SPFH domain-containing protein [Rhodanobacter sp. L36]